MVGVVVREEDLAQLQESHVATEQLALGALRAVEEQAVAATTNKCRGRGTLGRRRGTGRPEEDDVEVHGGRF